MLRLDEPYALYCVTMNEASKMMPPQTLTWTIYVSKHVSCGIGPVARQCPCPGTAGALSLTILMFMSLCL